MTQPRVTEVGSCVFSCEVLAPVGLVSSSHVERRSSPIASATSFTFLSSVRVLGFPGFVSLSFRTQTPRKRLAQRETVLQLSVNSPETSLKAPWISLGICARKVSILMYDF